MNIFDTMLRLHNICVIFCYNVMFDQVFDTIICTSHDWFKLCKYNTITISIEINFLQPLSFERLHYVKNLGILKIIHAYFKKAFNSIYHNGCSSFKCFCHITYYLIIYIIGKLVYLRHDDYIHPLRNMPKRNSPDSPMFEQFLNKIQANYKTKFVESESDTVSESNESDEHSYDGDTETESEYEVETADKE